MINSERFAIDPEYRNQQFQTIAFDRPLVAHFSANNPSTLLAAARLVENQCDAIDINLGCPQRIAFTGHFGSYLLGPEDRELVLSMVRELRANLSIPVFVKIRLLDSVPESIELVQQLKDSGACLIAIHGRYRVNLVGRTGPGARDGPAHLDQVRGINSPAIVQCPNLEFLICRSKLLKKLFLVFQSYQMVML
jgi:tRNA-dihydrouridine synthase 1